MLSVKKGRCENKILKEYFVLPVCFDKRIEPKFSYCKVHVHWQYLHWVRRKAKQNKVMQIIDKKRCEATNKQTLAEVELEQNFTS